MAKVFGEKWEIVDDIDSGGQAHVYRVRDTGEPNRVRALKRLKNTKRLARLENEMKALTQIDHPNVVKLVDYHVSGEEPYYIVVDLLEGGNLAGRKQRYKGDIASSLRLFSRICAGVIAAHTQDPQIIHRDLKPDNILFRSEKDDDPVIVDFGLCWIDDDGIRCTASDEPVGSRFFIAPELEDGRLDAPNAQCDVYNLGKVLYYILTGGEVFSREGHREPQYDLNKMWKHLGKSPLESAQIEYVSRLLDRMIVKDPAQRYGTVSEVQTTVRSCALASERWSLSNLRAHAVQVLRTGGVRSSWTARPAAARSFAT